MISVIMPSLNCRAYIAKAIESVGRQTTEQAIELIVVDNGSTDGTGELVLSIQKQWETEYGENRKLILASNPVKGVAGSRNLGIGLAHGEYVAFLDADDWWEETKLAKQLRVLDEDKECRLCSAGRELMLADGSQAGRSIGTPEYITYQQLQKQNVINCSAVLLYTKTARRYPMEHDDSHEDYIMWLRILRDCGYARAVNEPLLKTRLSEDGKSRNKLKSAQMTWKVYRYMGYSFIKSLWCFVNYTIAGFRKYYG